MILLGIVLLLIGLVVGLHIWGSRRNKSIATGFLASIAPVLTKEFAQVGFSKPASDRQESSAEAAINAVSNQEFVSYATGRNNIAFMHTAIKLQHRNNPITLLIEFIVSFLFDQIPMPRDTITMIIQPFDGAEPTKVHGNSKYDNFVWALVNKRQMRRWRDERYDLSLTRTSDWEGLPEWLAVMGESKEIGDTCLYKELKDVVKECQSFFEMILVTDLPKEKPSKLSELTSRKRITLELALPAPSTSPELLQRLVSAFIRLTDHLVANAHFRAEVLRKVKATREEETRKLKRALEEETKEERELKLAEKKKADRDTKLRAMSAAEQKKFLEKERQREAKDAMRRQVRKG